VWGVCELVRKLDSLELGTLAAPMPVVLIISYSGALGGAERILLDFADGLEGERNLACPEGPLAQAARARGIRVLGLRARSLAARGSAGGRLRALRHLAAHGAEARRLIDALDPDVVLSWGMRSALACLCGPPIPVPVVFQHNDLLPGPVIARAVRRAAARAEHVLALSNTIASDLDPHGQLAGRLSVIHPGVDVDRFTATSRPAQPPEILVLGALVEWKRPEFALEAVALARAQRPDLRLRLVGGAFGEDGDELSERLRRRAAAPDLAGAVELVGAVDDARAELARATCLLHCAPREPFGMAVLEALASARPAIVPSAAGPAEIVEQASGRLYPPEDARAAADALLEVTGDPELAALMGANGRRRAQQRFGLAASQRRFAAVVERAVRTSAPVSLRPSPAQSLTVVTVAHNSAAELGRLLASVQRHLPGTRVVVVDSGSADESLSVARAAEATTVIDLGRNVGFGRACNAGVAAVQTPITVLLNPDVELVDDSLLGLIELALEDAADRLLAPLVLLGDGRRQDSVHPVPTSAADLIRALVPPGLLPRRLAAPLAPWRAQRPRRVGWAVGCAVLAKTETFRGLGPFDEHYFLYGEDLDLGLRAAACGIETWFHPESRVVHERAHASKQSFGGEPFTLLARTRHDAVLRRLGAGRARIDVCAQALTFSSRAALKRAAGRPYARERAQLRALRDLRRAAGR
jgi:GT2 family glycosyltransferase/glycosyltransferase involved in cell wall biosynthesis